jgi:hypothetical protein
MILFALLLKLICFGECTGISFIDPAKTAICKTKPTGQLEFFIKQLGTHSIYK